MTYISVRFSLGIKNPQDTKHILWVFLIDLMFKSERGDDVQLHVGFGDYHLC